MDASASGHRFRAAAGAPIDCALRDSRRRRRRRRRRRKDVDFLGCVRLLRQGKRKPLKKKQRKKKKRLFFLLQSHRNEDRESIIDDETKPSVPRRRDSIHQRKIDGACRPTTKTRVVVAMAKRFRLSPFLRWAVARSGRHRCVINDRRYEGASKGTKPTVPMLPLSVRVAPAKRQESWRESILWLTYRLCVCWPHVSGCLAGEQKTNWPALLAPMISTGRRQCPGFANK